MLLPLLPPMIPEQQRLCRSSGNKTDNNDNDDNNDEFY